MSDWVDLSIASVDLTALCKASPLLHPDIIKTALASPVQRAPYKVICRMLDGFERPEVENYLEAYTKFRMIKDDYDTTIIHLAIRRLASFSLTQQTRSRSQSAA